MTAFLNSFLPSSGLPTEVKAIAFWVTVRMQKLLSW